MNLDELSTEDLIALRDGNLDKVSTEGLLKLQSMGGKDAPSSSVTQVDDTQAADIGWQDRFAIKNFGTNPDDSVAYLQKQRPDLEVRNFQGEIYARKPGEEKFKPLDPKGFDWKDITDIAADAVIGLGSGAATASGGLAGAVTGGLVGGLPGAMLAGSASSAGLEALRQAIGKGIGVNQEMDYGDVGMAGAFGAASPLVFGSGATAAKIAEAANVPEKAAKLLAKEGSAGLLKSKDTKEQAMKRAVEILTEQQRGAVKLVPEFMEFMSGVSADRIRNATKVVSPSIAAKFEVPEGSTQLDIVKKIDSEGLTDFMDATADEVALGLKQARNSLQTQIGQALKEGDELPVGEIKNIFESAIDDQLGSSGGKSGLGTDVVLSDIKRIKAKADELFGNKITNEFGDTEIVVKDKLSPVGLMQLKQRLRDLADIGKNVDAMNVNEKAVSVAASKALDVVEKKLDDYFEAYAKKTKDESLLKKYQIHKDLERSVLPKFGTPEATFRNLRNLDGKGKQIFSERIKNIDAYLGTNLGERAEVLDTWATFSKPSLSPVSTGGGTSTGRAVAATNLGTLVGGAAGTLAAGPIGGVFGGMIGRTAANLAGSPAAINLGLQTRQGISKLADRAAASRPSQSVVDLIRQIPEKQRKQLQGAAGLARQAAPVSAWQMFNAGGER